MTNQNLPENWNEAKVVSDRDEITALRLQEVDGSNEHLNEINKGYDDAMRQDPDQTE